MFNNKEAEKRFAIAIGIVLLSFFHASFVLQGLHLFDNDYNQWIQGAEENSWRTVLLQVFNPVLSDWNVNFRPVQTLIFKVLFSFFQFRPSGYYYFKAAALAF